MYYIAHRLFAAHDRALAAQLAHELALKIGEDQIFLPFCDTAEEDLVADVKGKRVFELDCDRLPRLRALIAIMHGPSVDDGVCMEIGYAAALHVPIVVMTTDFQDYSTAPASQHTPFPDPLLDAVATQILRTPRLGPVPGTAGSTRFAAFAARNQLQIHHAVRACTEAILHLPTSATGVHESPARADDTVYVEPSPYAAAEDNLLTDLTAHGIRADGPTRFNHPDAASAARADWLRASTAPRIVIDVCGAETPPGAALLIGAACATGRPVAAYLPRATYTHAAGREPNHRNLMVQYGLTATFTCTGEAAAWLRQ
ncbi:nucleoside 2-deoxyribosyltransferase [Streptomyces sp. ODS28]|uniref:nucleoside 2-deoxyribosyltransferase n=1 Tax=Streptomyces sp. ODS28 TaxID=3136688 RepID=UPI0031E9AE23